MHRPALLVAATSAALLAALPAGAAVAPGQPGRATVAVGETSTVASQGATCTSTRGADSQLRGSCTDVAYPLPMHGSVTLKPRRRLRMQFEGHATSVMIILRLKRQAESRSVYAAAAGMDSRNHHRFKALLPRRIPCAALLDMLVRSAAGETDYWVRIHTPGCVRR